MLHKSLEQRKSAHLFRVRKLRSSAQNTQVWVEGRQVINFSSNDYLGLADHSALKQAAINAITKYGVGSGASQMISGYHSLQQTFEHAIADFLGFEAALVFSSGYLANMGVLMALGLRHSEFFTDKENHASLIDGVRASFGKVRRYQHPLADDLARQLSLSQAKQRWIVTEGLFSMDGSIAPLKKLAILAQLHQADLIVDDAHGIGVLGANGRGSCEYENVSSQEISCLIGTLGKSFGGSGAFVCGRFQMIEYLKQFSRTAIYSTAIPPAWMASALAALEIIVKQPEKRQRLFEVIQYFQNKVEKTQLSFFHSCTPIQALLVGENEKTMAMQNQLFQQGLWVGAIRPPTVAANSARLRISLTADHEPQQLDHLIAALQQSEIV